MLLSNGLQELFPNKFDNFSISVFDLGVIHSDEINIPECTINKNKIKGRIPFIIGGLLIKIKQFVYDYLLINRY